jgi:hypothetical protein
MTSFARFLMPMLIAALLAVAGFAQAQQPAEGAEAAVGAQIQRYVEAFASAEA